MMPPEDVHTGLAQLASDLATDAWDARHGSLRTQSHYDAGYSSFVAEVAK
ncbi:MAG: hypothetical protein SFY80_00870 [Verrucomicrobiota bacterium]|nr:hypothetical protein [Verrucomicrobiota bacterium]